MAQTPQCAGGTVLSSPRNMAAAYRRRPASAQVRSGSSACPGRPRSDAHAGIGRVQVMNQLVAGLLQVRVVRLGKVVADNRSISNHALHQAIARRDSGRGAVAVAMDLPVVRIGECEFPALEL